MAVPPGEWERAHSKVSSGPAESDCYLRVLADMLSAQAAFSSGKGFPYRQHAFLGCLGCIYAGLVPEE